MAKTANDRNWLFENPASLFIPYCRRAWGKRYLKLVLLHHNNKIQVSIKIQIYFIIISVIQSYRFWTMKNDYY